MEDEWRAADIGGCPPHLRCHPTPSLAKDLGTACGRTSCPHLSIPPGCETTWSGEVEGTKEPQKGRAPPPPIIPFLSPPPIGPDWRSIACDEGVPRRPPYRTCCYYYRKSDCLCCFPPVPPPAHLPGPPTRLPLQLSIIASLRTTVADQATAAAAQAATTVGLIPFSLPLGKWDSVLFHNHTAILVPTFDPTSPLPPADVNAHSCRP